MIFFFTVPHWIQTVFNSFVWHIKTNKKVLSLTFDDGPIPDVTEFVVEQLAKYNAKATFFCVGENIAKNPQIFEKLLAGGHAVGNHTYNHLKGWQTKDAAYFANVEKFEEAIVNFRLKTGFTAPIQNVGVKLFRPPYGQIKSSQAAKLKNTYKIIMWDVLTCDYDKKLSEEKCLKNAIANSKAGSIVVFHDSLKAERNLRYVLPRYLKHFDDLGYKFESIVY
ncbi:MAG: polysaccharide deacetylase family protein [Cytophagales bacterium]